jgi:hypothetical protein
MASIFGSDALLHGGSFDMLSLEHDDVLLIRDPSEPCREIVRKVLVRELVLVGRLAG